MASTGDGACDIRSTAFAVFGNAMTSRMDASPQRIATTIAYSRRALSVNAKHSGERLKKDKERLIPAKTGADN